MTEEKKTKPLTKKVLINALIQKKEETNETEWLKLFTYPRLDRGWTVPQLQYELNKTKGD